ncbi:hypothetical protein Acr_00g0024280 [Actinidia rufa]|uniref:Uncharacterized protein n=1 Tax=Actinidia rufa TaxID=165716 RepID=A0A7J0DDI9_9ERIC|nr:hypothetical protein Acr_00g0024280 [Actinidia rufa]
MARKNARLGAVRPRSDLSRSRRPPTKLRAGPATSDEACEVDPVWYEFADVRRSHFGVRRCQIDDLDSDSKVTEGRAATEGPAEVTRDQTPLPPALVLPTQTSHLIQVTSKPKPQIPLDECSYCHQKGHWKHSCPNRGQSKGQKGFFSIIFIILGITIAFTEEYPTAFSFLYCFSSTHIQ